MERKKFITHINMSKVENEDLFLGKLIGAEHALCKKGDKHYYHFITDNRGDKIMIVECTEPQYRQFCKVVEEMHPGICDFDI